MRSVAFRVVGVHQRTASFCSNMGRPNLKVLVFADRPRVNANISRSKLTKRSLFGKCDDNEIVLLLREEYDNNRSRLISKYGIDIEKENFEIGKEMDVDMDEKENLYTQACCKGIC